jgi:chromosome segregation ATPase
LQAAYPSPFYFFDELDAALDASNAARVAAYIRGQARGQYIVVSHKPQAGPASLHADHESMHEAVPRALNRLML